MAQLPTGRAFELDVLDQFMRVGMGVIVELTGLDKQYLAALQSGQDEHRFARDQLNGHTLFESMSAHAAEWIARMQARWDRAPGFHAVAHLFQLHSGAIQNEAGTEGLGGLIRLLLRELVDSVPRTKEERTELLCETVALMVCDAKPHSWRPSLSYSHPIEFARNFWPAFGEESGAAVLRPLCRQIVEQRLWILPDGRFSPDQAAGARAQALCIPEATEYGDEPWRQRLRGLLVEALRCGWISVAEAESVIALDPALEPWWLLASRSADMASAPAPLRDFQARLRTRFPARLEALAGERKREPRFLINLAFDREDVDRWMGGYRTEYASLVGGESVIGAVRWAAANPGKLGSPRPTQWAEEMRRLAAVAGLDSDESGDLLAERLRAFPASALEDVLPWARAAQPWLLKALGLAELEPLRRWLAVQAGQDPAAPGMLGIAMANDSDPANGVIDLAGLLRASADIDPGRCLNLIRTYTRAGMVTGMDKLVAAALGISERGAVLEAALARQDQGAIKQLGLLPATGQDDVRERYLALQQLGRMARQHGAQRQATQHGAVQAGLSNLAQVAGYPDRAELEWAIESGEGARLLGAFAPAPFGEHQAWIAIDRLKPLLMLRNADGKVLKTVPPGLKKDEAFVALSATFADVKEQLARFTRLMENRMVDGQAFNVEQLDTALGHPVMAPIIGSLVWADAAGHTGLYRDGALVGPNGCHVAAGVLHLVHGARLLQQEGGAALLSVWQRRLVEEGVVQAFKQIFREIYLPTPAELGERSARYAGRAIRTGTAQALLQARGWAQAERDGGPDQQRRFADGVMAHCGFAAGHYLTEQEVAQVAQVWFTRAGQPLALEAVPIGAFSEAMRDIDLVVSIAGSDDSGEASLPTMELRAQLLQAIGQSLPPDVLRLARPFVHVKGQLANYRIHLGSGHVYVEPGLHVCIIADAAVTGKQDKLRLPFAEDDRQTALLLSKVMLLVDDDKIKGAAILAQIREGR